MMTKHMSSMMTKTMSDAFLLLRWRCSAVWCVHAVWCLKEGILRGRPVGCCTDVVLLDWCMKDIVWQVVQSDTALMLRWSTDVQADVVTCLCCSEGVGSGTSLNDMTLLMNWQVAASSVVVHAVPTHTMLAVGSKLHCQHATGGCHCRSKSVLAGSSWCCWQIQAILQQFPSCSRSCNNLESLSPEKWITYALT